MIFQWEEYFGEDLVSEGVSLEDNVSDIIRAINYIHAHVKQDNEDFKVSFDIGDDFQIEKCECTCGKKKCCHMTAVLHALELPFNKYIEYDMLVDSLDKDKLIKFLESELSCNKELLDDFKDEFRQDYLHHELMPYEDELFAIFDTSYDWEDDLKIYIEHDLMDSYNEGNYSQTLYLITLLMPELLEKVTYNSTLKESYNIVFDLIKKITPHCENLVFDYICECIEHNYPDLYPPFGKIVTFFNKTFTDDKYLKRKKELLG